MRFPGQRVIVVAATLAIATGLLTACGAPSPTDGRVHLDLSDGSPALQWGDGDYGVVLVPDDGETLDAWAPLAAAIAAHHMTALAIDVSYATGDRLAAAAEWLTGNGVQRVAFVASGQRGPGLVVAYVNEAGVVDQLVAISGDMSDIDLADLGEPPKLFTAAEGDAAAAAAAERMTNDAAGDWNALFLTAGEAHGQAILDSEGGPALIEAIVARLEERR
jgi:hypothetical protein